MVPYVRKSFVKHFRDGLKYIENNDFEFAFDDQPLDAFEYWYQKGVHEKAYNYAIDMTEKELQQAVEGMYHNLK